MVLNAACASCAACSPARRALCEPLFKVLDATLVCGTVDHATVAVHGHAQSGLECRSRR